jgi:trimethylamine--corrinoid protein Co-methyltransferase
MDAIREVGPGSHYLGATHTQNNFQTAFFRSEIADNSSFEQWESEGAADTAQRANKLWKKKLESYEAPALDESVDEALRDFIQRKKDSMPDSFAT